MTRGGVAEKLLTRSSTETRGAALDPPWKLRNDASTENSLTYSYLAELGSGPVRVSSIGNPKAFVENSDLALAVGSSIRKAAYTAPPAQILQLRGVAYADLVGFSRASITIRMDDPDTDFWAARLPELIARITQAEDSGELSPEQADVRINEVLVASQSVAPTLLNALLARPGRLGPSPLCTLLRALGRAPAADALPSRTQLMRLGLKHPAPSVRDAAATALLDAEALSEWKAIEAAMQVESNPVVRAGMKDILGMMGQ